MVTKRKVKKKSTKSAGVKVNFDDGKVDDKKDLVENKEVEVEEVEEVKELVYVKKGMAIDSEGEEYEAFFLLPEYNAVIEKDKDALGAIDSEINLFALKKENVDHQIENMKLQIKLMDRDARDIDTAIFHKKTEKKNIKLRHAEFVEKIGREIGAKKNSFGINPDTLEIVTD